MNPIERVFTSIIQAFLRIAVELVKGLFGMGARAKSDPDEAREPEESESGDTP